MANKMADKKKNASQRQSQLAAVPAKARSDEKGKEQSASTVQPLQSVPSKGVKPREERKEVKEVKEQPRVEATAKPAKVAQKKEPPKRETRPVRRDAKEQQSILKRLRNTRIGRFVYEAYFELRYKVTWPTFQEARNMTVIVIIISAVIGIILGVVDYGLQSAYLAIIKLVSGGK